MKNKSTAYIKRFSNIRVLVIGDAMLDRYCYGSVERICREAPVPIVDIADISEMPGGAANAAVNLATLGAKTNFITVVGEDMGGNSLLRQLEKFGINTEGIISDLRYQTMTKTRIMAKEQLLLRFDMGSRQVSLPKVEQEILEKLAQQYFSNDAILISDYGYGCVTDTIRKFLKKLQQHSGKICVIDAKYPEQYADFSATAIKPNYEEAVNLLGIQKSTDFLSSRAQQIIAYREDLLRKLSSDLIAVTLDAEGAVIIGRDGSYHQSHAISQPDSKAAGAGDTYVSALLLSLAAGASMIEAGEIAGKAASITVQKSATAFCSRSELRQAYTKKTKLIKTVKKLANIIELLKQQQKKIVFTNGCFDILHPGHVSYLHAAKSLGDILIIGINSDKSIRRIKGENRPINPLPDRIQVLMGLSGVDYVIPFDENTPVELIEKIKPDIYVKGGDYTQKVLPEAKVVKENGGEVKIIPLQLGKSTTHIINKIQTYNGGANATS